MLKKLSGKPPPVKPQAEGSHGGTLAAGAYVIRGRQSVRGVVVRLICDFTIVAILVSGPDSSIRLDKFVYDPINATGTVAIEATRGSFRFVTGSQGKGAIRVGLPMALLACAVEES